MKVTPWLLVQAERMTLKSVNKQSFFFLEALGGLQISYGQVNSIYLNAGLGLGGLYIDSQRKSNYSAYLLEIGIAHEL